ncbi:type II toxin-antitoxin system Phd/YefM family antitoxin [Actinocrispum wychmicini]|uniref:Antitoxin n=1 Tax=Actinocrispum wychmicini TaxID=1213861 RepID=A0A4R2JBI7_9PSEU|nr:type II toxin-antitoxin system Phd/YefM family antitoxin [Actinocrispum wychmicini]TCO56843.1 prevent-host-death family protein [Actinocrispum wychmicini]
MSVQVNIYEAKTRLSQLVDQAVDGEDVIIARNGTPVARLVPFQRPAARRQPGALRGKIWMAPDFDETPEDLIDLFYDGDPANPA